MSHPDRPASLLRAGQGDVVGTYVVGYLAPNGDWQVIVVPEATGQVTVQADTEYPEIRGDHPLEPVRTVDRLYSFLASFATRGGWTMYRGGDPAQRPIDGAFLRVEAAVDQIRKAIQ